MKKLEAVKRLRDLESEVQEVRLQDQLCQGNSQ